MTHQMATRAGMAAIITIAAAIVGVLFVGAPHELNASARSMDCRFADRPAPDAKPKQLRRAIKCLINAKREQRGRRVLRGNRALAEIARRHTRVMLRTGCFKHRCGREARLSKRIEKSDYLKGGGRYGYAENLGCATTARRMFREWMNSRFNKRNMLRGRYRHIGVGALRGSPTDKCVASKTATYTVLVAWRKR